MALNFLQLLDITSSGDNVYEGFEKVQTSLALLDDLFHGYCRRSTFRWKDADEIYIGAGVYFHEGTADRVLYWSSELTFQLGSAGSNSDSDDLGADEWHYIYLDDSAIVTAATGLITNSEILNDTTAPTWSASKQGWYNGNDRCIFAVLTDGSNNVLEFFHSGRLFQYADAISVYSDTPSTTWADVILKIPGFCRLGEIIAYAAYVNAQTYLVIRTNDQTGTSGHRSGVAHEAFAASYQKTSFATDSAATIEVKFATATTNIATIYSSGWYLPNGM